MKQALALFAFVAMAACTTTPGAPKQLDTSETG